jgi:hypothetical protein
MPEDSNPIRGVRHQPDLPDYSTWAAGSTNRRADDSRHARLRRRRVAGEKHEWYKVGVRRGDARLQLTAIGRSVSLGNLR